VEKKTREKIVSLSEKGQGKSPQCTTLYRHVNEGREGWWRLRLIVERDILCVSYDASAPQTSCF
jgi:hypothetical protein